MPIFMVHVWSPKAHVDEATVSGSIIFARGTVPLFLYDNLTFWRRNYFFNFSTPVYKM